MFGPIFHAYFCHLSIVLLTVFAAINGNRVTRDDICKQEIEVELLQLLKSFGSLKDH